MKNWQVEHSSLAYFIHCLEQINETFQRNKKSCFSFFILGLLRRQVGGQQQRRAVRDRHHVGRNQRRQDSRIEEPEKGEVSTS